MTFKVSPDGDNASQDRLASGIFSLMRYSRLMQIDPHYGCEMSCNWEGWINRRTSSRRTGPSGGSGGSHFLPWITYCLETSSHSWVGIGCFHTNSNINSFSALHFLMFVSPEVEEPARAAEAGLWILRAWYNLWQKNPRGNICNIKDVKKPRVFLSFCFCQSLFACQMACVYLTPQSLDQVLPRRGSWALENVIRNAPNETKLF